MSSVEKFIGESQLKSTPTKKFTFIIDDEKVTTAKIADNAITEKKISGEDTPEGAAVTTSKIKDGAVTNPKIANGAVTTIKIQDFDAESSFPTGVTNEKLADASVTESKLASGAVTEGKIAPNAVTAGKIADDAVIEGNIAPGAVTHDNLTEGCVQQGNIANGAVEHENLAPNAVQEGNITPGAIHTEDIHDGAVTTAKIEDYNPNSATPTGITTAKIADEAITEGKLADGAITTEKLATPVIEQLQTIMDEVPTEGSVKPINSAGVLAHGSAFDISEYNKNEGVLATYESLTAAISAVPATSQRGGMSIKYVQSSDNKYVQFICMAQSFTTDVTQWQGVDDEPTVGSDNLVKSGGVHEKFLNIKKLISGFIPTTCTFTVSDDGETISVSAGYCFYGNRNISVSAHTIDTTVLNGNFGYLYYDQPDHKYYLAAYTSADIENSMICGVFRPADKTLALFDSYWMVRQLKSISAAISYAECSSPAGQGTKVVNVDDYTSLLKGGCLKIKMQYGHTYANGATLKINNTYTKTLYYNGHPCSSTNGWHAGDIIEVFYDGSVFQAFSTSNAFVTGQGINNLSLVNDVPAFDDYSDAIATGRAVLKAMYNTVADKAGKLTDFFMYQNWIRDNGNYLGADIGHLSYKCVCVPVVSGDVIKISKAANTNAYCAFLKSESNVDNFTVSNPAADLCSGESRRIIEADASNPYTLTAPSDAAYLYVGIYNGTDCTPRVFTVNGYDYTKSVRDHITSLNSKIDEVNAELYSSSVLPTTEWKDKSFNAAAGTDGIFFDKRNKISSANRLTKIGVKAKSAGVVKIHYLSTISPYTEIANETHQVISGINEFIPTANLAYEEEMYVAFSNDATSNPGIRLIYPSDHTGQSIKKVIATGVISEQDYPYALWIYTNKNKLSDIEEKIEAEDITTLPALKKALSDNIGHIMLGAGTITLDGTLSIPSGTKITGVRGKSVISVPASVLKGIELSEKEDIVIENITLVGAYNGTPLKSGLQPVKPGIVDSADDARQFVNAGYQTDLTNGGVTSTYVPQIGINIKECEKIEIIGCEIKNFSYYGIANALSGKNYRYACKFENNYINNCYCGIYIYKEAERSQYIANNVSLCQIGLYMDSGTNMFTDCAFNANRIGMFMNNGWNHAHGVQTGNAFTHCSLYSLYAYNVENGEVFSQCKFGYVDSETEINGNAIYAKCSRGLVFNNCQMISCNIKFDGKFYLHYTGKTNGTADQFGNTNYVVTYEDISDKASQYNGGVSQILGSCYISGGGTITLSSDLDATNVVMKNNFFISGQDSSGVNN